MILQQRPEEREQESSARNRNVFPTEGTANAKSLKLEGNTEEKRR